MIFQAYFPGEDEQKNKNLKLPKSLDTSLESMCKKCQIKSTPFCLPSIKQAVISDVKADKLVAKHFKHQSKEILSKAVDKYLAKCVEFSWIACFEEPEVRLITAPNKECTNISKHFIGLVRTTHQSRHDSACVEWPAIIQGDNVKFPWQLYTLNQPRPVPKKIHEERSKDFRVTGIEGIDGQLVRDTQDDGLIQAEEHSGSVSSKYTTSHTKSEEGSSESRNTHVDMKETTKGDSSVTVKADNVKPKESDQAKPVAYRKTQKVKEGHQNTQF